MTMVLAPDRRAQAPKKEAPKPDEDGSVDIQPE
jgi:hypothetical protein